MEEVWKKMAKRWVKKVSAQQEAKARDVKPVTPLQIVVQTPPEIVVCDENVAEETSKKRMNRYEVVKAFRRFLPPQTSINRTKRKPPTIKKEWFEEEGEKSAVPVNHTEKSTLPVKESVDEHGDVAENKKMCDDDRTKKIAADKKSLENLVMMLGKSSDDDSNKIAVDKELLENLITMLAKTMQKNCDDDAKKIQSIETLITMLAKTMRDTEEKQRNHQGAYKRSAFSEEGHSLILPVLGIVGIVCQMGQLIYQHKLDKGKDYLERTYDLTVFVLGIAAYVFAGSKMSLRLVPKTPEDRFLKLSWAVDECISLPSGLFAIVAMNAILSIPFAIGVLVFFSGILVVRYYQYSKED